MAASEYSNFKKIKIIYYSCYPQFIDVENMGRVKYKKRIIFGEISLDLLKQPINKKQKMSPNCIKHLRKQSFTGNLKKIKIKISNSL